MNVVKVVKSSCDNGVSLAMAGVATPTHCVQPAGSLADSYIHLPCASLIVQLQITMSL